VRPNCRSVLYTEQSRIEASIRLRCRIELQHLYRIINDRGAIGTITGTHCQLAIDASGDGDNTAIEFWRIGCVAAQLLLAKMFAQRQRAEVHVVEVHGLF
jgi:hypothetical protein